MVIDSHHHFWRYDPVQYPWIDDAMAAIRRDFLPAHLKAEIAAAGVEGVVSVQARQSLEETRWLLGLADQYEFIRGVVGWVPLASSHVARDLARLAHFPKLKGVRHVLQGAPAGTMLRPDFNRGVARLREYGLVYDLLIYANQLPEAIQFVDQHPDQLFVLDHIAKPRIRENLLSPWQENLRELARRPNVVCKLSGLVTEADYHTWTEAQLRPYMETVLEAFGPRRVMFGSDWPVCLVACSYQGWCALVRRFVATLTAEEQARVLGETAIETYAL
ncbi:MAG: amidohydrolase family protein [Armatimonadota bacterium]|nr:amidohydrolase family protein [Armatimonadota bacterium]